MLSIAVLGAAYTIIQIGLTVARISAASSNSANSDPLTFFNFFGDKVSFYEHKIFEFLMFVFDKLSCSSGLEQIDYRTDEQNLWTLRMMLLHLLETIDLSYTFLFSSLQIASYLLATGAAAGFAVTKDLQRMNERSSLELDRFFDRAYASAGLLLLGFVCVGLLSVAASFNLPKIAWTSPSGRQNKQEGQRSMFGLSWFCEGWCWLSSWRRALLINSAVFFFTTLLWSRNI